MDALCGAVGAALARGGAAYPGGDASGMLRARGAVRER
jgi:hypothetical protein